MITTSWNKYIDTSNVGMSDIYFCEEYCKLYERESTKAMAYIYDDGTDRMLFPFLVSPIPGTDELFDFETPYGYGGPVCSSGNPEFLSAAWEGFISECSNMSIVAGFVRFHPILGNQKYLGSRFSFIDDRKTIAIDLKPSMEDIWGSQIHSKNRNVIRKAVSAGLRYEVDSEFKYLDRFKRLYNETMDKLSADSFYYFPDEYYDALRTGLYGRSYLATVWLDDKLVSSAIIMYSDNYGHYHLAGSDRDYLGLSPNNLLLWETACELKKMGKSLFHLGGGTNSDPDNSLFSFKKKFSKNELQFSIGKMIVMEKEYLRLCSDWESRNPEKVSKFGKFALRYRY
jgi:Uncharacterized protein involved in methicillin resistance